MPGLQALLLGTLAATNLGLLRVANRKPSKGPVHQGLNKDEDLVWLSGCPRRVEGFCEAQANGIGRPGALRRAGRPRGPSSLGSLALPESLGRASGWLLLVRTTRSVKSLGRTFQTYNGPSFSLWMSSLRKSSLPGWPTLIGRRGSHYVLPG
jgi:hypothetical protein